MTKTMSICLLVLVAGCKPEPTMRMREQTAQARTPEIEDSSRITVTRIGVFADDLAYENRRGVYVIVDTETGEEFIGISGVGITETGRHSCGKNCTREDER